jgi:Cu/Ag efflux protein CusF
MFAVISGTAATALAVSETESNKTVGQMSANSVTASVTVTVLGPSTNCAFGLIQFNPTTALGRVWYATLLEALSTNAPVDIVYDRSGNACTVTQVNIR